MHRLAAPSLSFACEDKFIYFEAAAPYFLELRRNEIL